MPSPVTDTRLNISCVGCHLIFTKTSQGGYCICIFKKKKKGGSEKLNNMLKITRLGLGIEFKHYLTITIPCCLLFQNWFSLLLSQRVKTEKRALSSKTLPGMPEGGALAGGTKLFKVFQPRIPVTMISKRLRLHA